MKDFLTLVALCVICGVGFRYFQQPSSNGVQPLVQPPIPSIPGADQVRKVLPVEPPIPPIPGAVAPPIQIPSVPEVQPPIPGADQLRKVLPVEPPVPPIPGADQLRKVLPF